MEDFSQALISKCVDSFRLQQIVSNLVGNAIRYTDSGAVTVERLVRPRA